MSVHGTRSIRNIAALLVSLSGVTHVAQLWFRDIDEGSLLTALIGMVYLLLGLGLSGQSRFTLWACAITTLAAAGLGLTLLTPSEPDALLVWHITADVIAGPLCLYILYRTRYADMD
jgi:hypothetical protein